MSEVIVTPPLATINTGDRLCITIFLAIILHIMLIIGVSFDINRGASQNPTIEVTLSHSASEEKPEHADYMAQDNQLGGGQLEKAALPSVIQPSKHVSQQAQASAPRSAPAAQPEQPQQTALITTRAKTGQAAQAAAQPHTRSPRPEPVKEENAKFEQAMGLMSLNANLDFSEQLQTRKSRTLQVSSVATLKTSDAFYVKQWIDKIQRVGSQNYPSEALQRNVEGSLKLTVFLLSDGSVQNIRVLRSSGHTVLDDAAINIVRRAGRFAPFSETMRRDYDQLEITRTWQFTRDGKTPVL